LEDCKKLIMPLWKLLSRNSKKKENEVWFCHFDLTKHKLGGITMPKKPREPLHIRMSAIEIFARRNQCEASSLSSLEVAHEIFEGLPPETQNEIIDRQRECLFGNKKK
jgi:hypothetical protein